MIGKALAVQLKSYDDFETTTIQVREFWEKITAKAPAGFYIKENTPLDYIWDAAHDSTNIPTVAARKGSSPINAAVSPCHGFAVVGFKNRKIQLYDPAKAEIIPLSPKDSRNDFQAILFKK